MAALLLSPPPRTQRERSFYFEAFVLSEKQIKEYKRLKDKEDVDLLVAINESMYALRDELEKYLAEADLEDAKEEKESRALIGVLGSVFEKFTKPLIPFANIGKGFAQLGKAFVPNTKKGVEKDNWIEKQEREELKKEVKKKLFFLYKTFRKNYKMITW